MNAGQQLEQSVERWRVHVLSAGATMERIGAAEAQLRATASSLVTDGLTEDEAFLVALRRLAEHDAPSRAYAARYSEELWGPTLEAAASSTPVLPKEFLMALGCAIAAAIAIKMPALFGVSFEGGADGFYTRNLSLLVLPFLGLYLWWARRISAQAIAAVGALFLAGAVFANVYPFTTGGSTETLLGLHLPIVLWLALGVVHAVGEWKSNSRRLEYLRFTGEWLVTYALIALGGGVLVALTVGVFDAIGVKAESFVGEWILPCGAAGAVVIAAWLVATRRNLVGGLAPMLARVFTPLFAFMLAALLLGVIVMGGFINVDRQALILLDLLLVVVLALLLYAISARDPRTRAGVFDWIQLALVACALVVDVFALANIVARLSEFGFTPNRVAAVGLNLILLVNLSWSALLQVRALRSPDGFGAVAALQTRYLPVYAVWAGVVVAIFPPLFGFI